MARQGSPSGLPEADIGRPCPGCHGLTHLQHLVHLPAQPAGRRARRSTLTFAGRGVARSCGHGGRRSRPRTAFRSGGSTAAAGRRNAWPARAHAADPLARPPGRSCRPTARVPGARGGAELLRPAVVSLRAVSHSGALQRPGDHLWAGQCVVRGYGTVCGYAAGTAHWQPAGSGVLRQHRRPPGSHRGAADRGDRIPAAGCRRDRCRGRTRPKPWDRLSGNRPWRFAAIGFLQGDVLPQAERAADLGLDPTPMLAVVSDVLRLYVHALEPGSRSTADQRLPVAPLEYHPERMTTERSRAATVEPWTVEMP